MIFSVFRFSKGKLFLLKSQKGLCTVKFIKSSETIRDIKKSLQKKNISLVEDETGFKLEKTLFDRYFSGKKEDLHSLILDLSFGTPFYQNVWQRARKIPYGKTESYKSLAVKLNHKGYRSIGQAMGANPLLIVIPCHRVIRTDGTLGGFGAGLDLKKHLLRLENKESPF